MTQTLSQILSAEPFEATRTHADLVRFHVWHRRAGIAAGADDAVRTALARGRGLAVVGDPGTGKTSTLLAGAIDPGGTNASYLPLPLSVMGSDVGTRAGDPRYLAGRLVRAIAQVVDEAKALADAATPTVTASLQAATWRAHFGGEWVKVEGEIHDRSESVTFERNPEEIMDAAKRALALAAESGLKLAVLLEDADGLLRLPGHTEDERRDIANAFFQDGLNPFVRELALPVLLAVQPEYIELEGFQASVDLIGAAVKMPTPAAMSPEGVHLLIGELLATAGVERQLLDVFEQDAIDLLAGERESIATIRRLLRVADRAVGQAASQLRDRVLVEDMQYALTQE